ncbi:MAG TPA: hypothetical protein VFD29_03145 [Gillisia sp.]|nr:hypothetical protein [Gillisia sp.]
MLITKLYSPLTRTEGTLSATLLFSMYHRLPISWVVSLFSMFCHLSPNSCIPTSVSISLGRDISMVRSLYRAPSIIAPLFATISNVANALLWEA